MTDDGGRRTEGKTDGLGRIAALGCGTNEGIDL